MTKRLLALPLFAIAMCALAQQSYPERVTCNLPNGKAPEAPEGTYVDDWDNIASLYSVPQWFKDAKFGIFIHWGVYSVPASGSEWYPKHMYNGLLEQHAAKWGAPDKFGYKDFIPLFKAEKFNPDEWAQLFVEAGAKYVIPTAEHHDGFAMYDSDYTEWDAKEKGPKRDIIGDLATAVRSHGLKFGVSNHRIENWDFMWPGKAASHDLFDPKYATLYGPPQKPTNASGMGPGEKDDLRHPQSDAFLEEWLARAQEIVDKYHPDLYYFDNGINYRSLDPWKKRFAAYYYNTMNAYGQSQVSIQSKSEAYLAGSIRDYERQNRAPKQLTDFYWQVDEPIGNKFGYIENLQIQSAEGIVKSLVNNIARNGNLCLNISPKSDGTIPENQQQVLRSIGKWLKLNGEGVYYSKPWIIDSEGDIRFTTKDNCIYVFDLKWNQGEINIRNLSNKSGYKVRAVKRLDNNEIVPFVQNNDALCLSPKTTNGTGFVTAFKIEYEL